MSDGSIRKENFEMHRGVSLCLNDKLVFSSAHYCPVTLHYTTK